jgi:hypothetical protein
LFAVFSRHTAKYMASPGEFSGKKIPAKPRLAGKSFLKREEETSDSFLCRAISDGKHAGTSIKT